LEVEQSGYDQLKQEVEAQIAVFKQEFLSREEQRSTAANVEDVYPMSNIQKGMVFGNMLYEGQGVYHDQAVYALGHIGFEKARFEKALQLMVDKHANLRAVFRLNQNGEDLQVVFKTISLPLSYHPIQIFHKDELELEVADFLKSERRKGFDLENGPLWRMRIFQAEASKPLLVFQFHHGIFDGWSLASFNTELLQVYHQLQSDPAFRPEKLSLTYKDFVVRELITQKNESIRAFWKEELGGYERADLFEDEDRDDEFEINIGTAYLKQLEALANYYDVSVKILTLSAYLLLLDRLTPQSELVIGAISNNRLPEEEGDKLLGCFLNSVPLKVPVNKDATAAAFVRQVKEKIESLRGKDQLTTLEIARLLGENSAEGNPIFDVIFNYIDFHIYEGLDAIGLGVEKMMEPGWASIPTFFERTNTWFDLTVNTTGNELRLKIQFSRKLKAGYTSQETVYKYLQILDTMIKVPQGKVADIPFLSEEERHRLLYTFNDTAATYPEDKTIIDLFEKQVEKTPDNTAVVFEDKQLTYRQLNEKANRLAHYLRDSYDIRPDDIIALQLERSEQMIIAILGTLKSGAAYLPIAPDAPRNRVVHMLSDSQAKVLLTDEATYSTAKEQGKSLPVLTLEKAANRDIVNPDSINTPQNLAYILYTSGSTGRPKGVMIEHLNVTRLLVNDRNLFDFKDTDVWTLFHYYGFDFSVWEIWGALLFGGSLIVVPKAATLDPKVFARLVVEWQVTVLNQVPSAFEQLQAHLLKKTLKEVKLRYIIFGGAKLFPAILTDWKLRFPTTKLINMYGITETTVHVTYKEIGEEEIRTRISNVGKAIPTLRCYILDKGLNPVPIGVAGELYIAGDGLARGYLNNPILNSERFIENPFEAGGRLYRSGDSGRWLKNGDIEFLGRLDFQLKIRGYRIEAGEVEQALLKHPAIQAAVVIGKEVGLAKELVAYLMGDERHTAGIPDVTSLRRYLSGQLPAYMIPTYFVELEALPLTANGKINRKALPQPEGASMASGTPYVAPGNKTEQALVEIWEGLLNRENIGVNDNFLDMGGHSLLAIRMVTLIHQELSANVSLATLFDKPTIAQLAQAIRPISQKKSGLFSTIPKLD
ncbi:MAG: amino acid adenylation domain-containing protein, partial [Phaeodactylibacter sp.]|nr:amino acid adenylation domain-containing protein [Phaeodactylibacter sp.]